MPVPRRFDRRPPERDQTRINDRIRVPEVRLIDENGQQVGVVKTPDALRYAEQHDLDLVEVAPDARPPVCRVLDYSKYKYEQAQKQKAARKHQQQITIREIKFRPKIASADYDTKKGHVERFLRGKDKVKVTIMFRGREQAHPERGVALLEKLAAELTEVGVVEQRPLLDGRNMTMMMGPSKTVLATEDEAPVVEVEPQQGKTSRRNRLAADKAGVTHPSTQAKPVTAPAADSQTTAAKAEPGEAFEPAAEPATEVEVVDQQESAVTDAAPAIEPESELQATATYEPAAEQAADRADAEPEPPAKPKRAPAPRSKAVAAAANAERGTEPPAAADADVADAGAAAPRPRRRSPAAAAKSAK